MSCRNFRMFIINFSN